MRNSLLKELSSHEPSLRAKRSTFGEELPVLPEKYSRKSAQCNPSTEIASSQPLAAPRNDVSKLAYKFFKFLASVKLAIIVILGLMAVLAAGTIIESLHGADAAKIAVYDSPWFSLLLILLGINVLAAALDRYPWKKRHTGFVITHIGIILVLIGSFITRHYGVDAQMAVEEGQTEHRITLPEPLIYVFSEAAKRDWIFPVSKKAFVWNGSQPLKPFSLRKTPAPFSLEQTSYYPKSTYSEEIKASTAGPSALKMILQSSFFTQTLWLVERDPARNEIVLGPATVKFAKEFLDQIKGEAPRSGYLEIETQNARIHLPLDETLKLPARLKVKGTPYHVRVMKMFKNAAVVGTELVDQNENDAAHAAGKNPAVQLTLEGSGLEERHTVFAKFPEFPTVHGMKPSASGLKIFYRLPNGGSKGETHEIRFVKSAAIHESPPLYYQIQDGFDIRTERAEIGKEVPLGWMDMKFKIEEYFRNSTILKTHRPEPNTTKVESAVPAIQVRIRSLSSSFPHGVRRESDPRLKAHCAPLREHFSRRTGRSSAKVCGDDAGASCENDTILWIQMGERAAFKIDGEEYHLMLGEKRLPVGFRLELRDFRLKHYPGTNSPASFESAVTLIDDSRGIKREATISMNEPLAHRGYKIYQSGYNLSEGQPEISIFSVGRDPGIWVKYLGAIVMVAGIITMYYTRAYSGNAGKIVSSEAK